MRRTSARKPTRRLQVGIDSLKEAAADFLATAKAVERGERPAPREQLDFADMGTLLRTLTPERWRLLHCVSQHGPLSVQKTAQALGRNYKNVHSDVQVLSEIGLLEKTEAGIRVPYRAIVVELKMAPAAAA